MNRAVAVSKALSKLLRHAAEDVGLKLDAEGYARLDDVVSTSTIHFLLLQCVPCKEKRGPQSGGYRQSNTSLVTWYDFLILIYLR
jgi:hypothetical protein